MAVFWATAATANMIAATSAMVTATAAAIAAPSPRDVLTATP
jgi:hypothetical protein